MAVTSSSFKPRGGDTPRLNFQHYLISCGLIARGWVMSCRLLLPERSWGLLGLKKLPGERPMRLGRYSWGGELLAAVTDHDARTSKIRARPALAVTVSKCERMSSSLKAPAETSIACSEFR